MNGNPSTVQNARARQSPIRKIRYLVVALAATGFGFVTAGSAWGQSTGAPASVSRPVVQPLPAARGMTLNAALARLAQNPRDTQAMIDAGKAALMLGDVDAAIGFFSRARTVDPLNPYAKAGLAGALVRQENPFEAIPLFQEAERAGVVDADLAADRGLAYDLVGDNATAQRYYREALARGSSEEVTRRLALSYAIAGDRISADATLAPLLARGDKAAFRSRAFAMAIAGQAEEAVGIAYGSLPQELAAAISPYLRYMTRLTPAQQAAAANFGHFPRASEIGRDDPRVAQYAAANPRRGTLASADAALVPKGEPLGRKSRTRTNRQTQREQRQTGSMAARPTPMAAVASQRAAPPEVQPGRQTVGPAAPATPATAPAPAAQRVAVTPSGELPPLASQAPAQPSVAVVQPTTPTMAPPRTSAPLVPVAAQPVVQPTPPSASVAVSRPLQGPGISTAAPPSASVSPPSGATVAVVRPPAAGMPSPPVAQTSDVAPAASLVRAPVASVPPPPPTPTPTPRTLADAFRDFTGPTLDQAPAAGAVDIRRITPARPPAPVEPARAAEAKGEAAKVPDARSTKAAKVAKPVAPSHPSRIWVQVATGRDKAALAFDWRRMTREKAEVFRGKSPSLSAWGQTNRLLTGPFQTEAAANAFLVQLRRAGIEGPFLWTSPVGQVVDALPTSR